MSKLLHEAFNNRVDTLKTASLRELCRQLGRDAAELQIYAKRYATERKSYAPSHVNEITERLRALGLTLNPGAEGTVWAVEGMGRAFDGLTEEHLIPGHPVATGHVASLRHGTRLDDELARLLDVDGCRLAEAVDKLKALLDERDALRDKLECLGGS